MKRVVLLLLMFLAVVWQAAAINLCDYRMPETNIADARLSFHYRYFHDPARPGAGMNDGRLAFTMSQLYDAPLLGFQLAASGDFVLRDFSLRGMDTQAGGRLQRYLAADEPFFAFGAFDAAFATGMLTPGLEVRTGIGYGRFADVTPLAKALRVERRLLDMGDLPAALPNETVMAVARVIGRAEEYESPGELLSAVDALVREASGVSISPAGLLEVEEIIQETGWQRYCGWNVSGGVGYEVLDPRGQIQDLSVILAADVALAPEPGSQLRLSASYAAVAHPTAGRSYITLGASFDQRISDTTHFVFEYALRQEAEGPVVRDRQSATFQLEVELGGISVAVQIAFGKRADAEAWTQDLMLSAVINLL